MKLYQKYRDFIKKCENLPFFLICNLPLLILEIIKIPYKRDYIISKSEQIIKLKKALSQIQRTSQPKPTAKPILDDETRNKLKSFLRN